MGEILNVIGQLFVQSIPTVIFVFLLLVILDRWFFRPLTAILKQREEATLGALARARAQAAQAEAKWRQYEAAFQTARQELYRLREADRRASLNERETALKKARQEAESRLKDAHADLAMQIEGAKQELQRTSRSLGLEIAETVLGNGRPVYGEGGSRL